MDTSHSEFLSPMRVLLVALFSDAHPAVGESHGISVLGGCIEGIPGLNLEVLRVVDMYSSESNERETDLLKTIKVDRPNVVGISVPYGSYTFLRNIYEGVKTLLESRDHLVIFGGALPTYLPAVFLREIDESAIVVRGEGDEALVRILQAWQHHSDFESIQNICYVDGHGIIQCNEKKLVNVNRISPPYRSHVELLIKKKAQIFIESSRGCSWGACTFCPRGLVDVKGSGDEYRRFSFDRLAFDLNKLNHFGLQAFTFADEDFLGGTLVECRKFVGNLENLYHNHVLRIPFDASMTIHSIYSNMWSQDENKDRDSLIRRLKHVGLRKVFLGVESGSASQLSRYRKGFQPSEAATACRIVRDNDLALEIGFIMFDPLSTMAEIEENVRFLQENDLAGVTSSLGSGLELRLQLGSRYLDSLYTTEEKLGTKLFDRQLDVNTLTYPSFYLEGDVSEVVSTVRNWNALLRPIYYPLKNLSRYGVGGILQEQSQNIRIILTQTRQTFLQRISEAIASVKYSGEISDNINEQFAEDLQYLGNRITTLFKDAPDLITKDPVFASMLAVAKSQAAKQTFKNGHDELG